MAQVSATTRAAGRSPIEWGVDRIWRFFCSVRAAVYEIALLALIVLLGTLRGSSVPDNIKDLLPFMEPVTRRWYAYNFFHSFPFMFLLGLLSIAIAICTMNRAPGIWKSITNPKIDTTHGFLNGADVSATFSSGTSPTAAVAAMTETLKSRRYRVMTETHGEEVHLYADRHRFAKLGTFPFHLALIMILIGGIVGARYGFRDTQFVIPEAETRDVGHGTGLSVKLDQFSDSYTENGTPSEYKSDLILYKDGKEIKRQSILVNHPMTYRTVVFYQSGFGQAATMQVTNSAGQVLFDGSIPLGIYTSKSNPNAPAGVQELLQAGYQLNVVGPNEALDGQPEIMSSTENIKLKSGQMYVQLVPTGPNASSLQPLSAVVGQGDTAKLGDLNVKFLRERRYTILQVGRNPGIPIFWSAALLLVGGLAVTFYFPHRRIRAIISASPRLAGECLIKAAPLAKRDWSGQRDFFRFVDSLQERLGSQPFVKGRTDQRSAVSATT